MPTKQDTRGRKRSQPIGKNGSNFIDDNSDDNLVENKTKGGRRSGRLADLKTVLNYAESPTRVEQARNLRAKPKYDFRDLDSEDPDNPEKRSSTMDKDWEMKEEDSDYSEEFNTPIQVNMEEEDLNMTTDPLPSSRRSQALGIGRRAAKVAMRKVQAMSASQSPTKPAPVSTKTFSPEIEAAAQKFATQRPISKLLKPLPLSSNRLTIDAINVALFAEESAVNLWASALSPNRFGGPRRHPPFRELHRLTEPDDKDASDWAENIRWAKEQFKLYGSVWTEYDYSLETITEHRRETKWVSEEAIMFGNLSG